MARMVLSIQHAAEHAVVHVVGMVFVLVVALSPAGLAMVAPVVLPAIYLLGRSARSVVQALWVAVAAALSFQAGWYFAFVLERAGISMILGIFVALCSSAGLTVGFMRSKT